MVEKDELYKNKLTEDFKVGVYSTKEKGERKLPKLKEKSKVELKKKKKIKVKKLSTTKEVFADLEYKKLKTSKGK